MSKADFEASREKPTSSPIIGKWSLPFPLSNEAASVRPTLTVAIFEPNLNE